MYKERFLLLGGAGLAGRGIAAKLSSPDREIFIADIRPDGSSVPTKYIQANVLEPGKVKELISLVKPVVVINCINVATIYSANGKDGFSKIVAFYLDLYRALVAARKPIHYLQVGTTGSGGLGFNIPFTHGENIEDLPIIHKAAFSGITTAMLTLLSRSFPADGVAISEVKPGLAIFADEITSQQFRGAQLVTLDGGESGHYTAEETLLLTHYMGMTFVSKVVEKVLRVLQEKKTIRRMSSYDIIQNNNETIIRPEREDGVQKKRVLREMKQRQGDRYILATGNLGPPSVTRDLILGHLLLKGVAVSHNAEFQEALLADPVAKLTLEWIQQFNPALYIYLAEQCSLKNFVALRDFAAKKKEAWQIVAAKLDQKPPLL